MTMLSILHPPALQTPAPWWETSQLWVSVGVLLLLGTVAILLWQGLVRLRAMEGHLTRLDLLEKVDGTLGRLVPALLAGQMGAAVLAQLAMTVLLAGYVALGVKSFKEARRARLAKG